MICFHREIIGGGSRVVVYYLCICSKRRNHNFFLQCMYKNMFCRLRWFSRQRHLPFTSNWVDLTHQMVRWVVSNASFSFPLSLYIFFAMMISHFTSSDTYTGERKIVLTNTTEQKKKNTNIYHHFFYLNKF
jgi:hypothetical protein